MNTGSKKKGPPKGVSNNPGGRPKGSKNKITNEIKRTLSLFMKRDIKTIKEDWSKLTPYQRVIMREKLLAYILPKPNDEITQEQLDEFLQQIKNIKS